MSRNVIETVMGAVVLVIAGGFLFTAYQGRQMQSVKDGYGVLARFDDASGIVTGTDVRVGGVKVGVVKSMNLDPKTYRANVTLELARNVAIPTDSSASVRSDGLIGSKFVSLVPGGSDEMLKEGGEIEFTQSSVSLEEMIGKFVFSGGGVDKDKAAASGAAPVDAPQEAKKDADADVKLSIP